MSRILICPLNWGLGHASRCSALIHQLQQEGNEIILAADGAARSYLQSNHPGLPVYDLPDIHVQYPRGGLTLRHMIRLGLMLLLRRGRDRRRLKKLVQARDIGRIISDNRPWLWHRKIHSIYLTHQLNVITGNRAAGWLVNRLHRRIIRNYEECWVPDYEGENRLSGRLTAYRFRKLPMKYLGPLSRFQGRSPRDDIQRKGVLVLLSGPEPHRSLLEHTILSQTDYTREHVIVIRGLPHEEGKILNPGSATFHNHLPDDDFIRLIERSRYIIARGGYSTIMDLHVLGRTAMLVPTPGQTEQEYLCRYLSEKGLFLTLDQKGFSLVKAVKMLGNLELN